MTEENFAAWRPRMLVCGSIVLYVAALFLPALDGRHEATSKGTIAGWECLVDGLIFSPLIVPLLCWLPNLWLLALWLQAASLRYTSKALAWGAAAMALASLGLLQNSHRPLLGASIWVGAMVTGGFAARQTEESRWRE